jgi:hypothetical protein
VLPTLDFSLDTYTNLSLRQAQESLQDFKLLNSSSTTLAGLPAHMIVFAFTPSQNTTLQNLATWTIKDGMYTKLPISQPLKNFIVRCQSCKVSWTHLGLNKV